MNARLIGFGFASHPVKADHFMELVIYQTSTEYIVCLSEGPGPGDTEAARRGLGMQVPLSAFAPFIVRRYLADKSIRPEVTRLMPDFVCEWAE